MTRMRIAGHVVVAAGLLIGLSGGAAGQPSMELEPDEALSPVRVETLDLEPTVVKTGDLILQTYRVRFPDLVGEGKEIIILEDRMVPETLPVHPFEGVSLDVTKRQVDNQHIWDFVYGFRLIAPEKATYVLPSFSFYYLVRDLGEDVEDAEVQQVDGGGGLVRYVSTLTDVPVMDLRDRIELGSFAGRATFFRTLAWTVAPLPLLAWVILLVRSARRPKTVSDEQLEQADELARLEAQIPVPPSIWEARRRLRQELRSLADLGPSTNGERMLDAERGLIIATREYLQAELPALHLGDTPRDIAQHVEGLKDGARKEALQMMSARLVTYQSHLERGTADALSDPQAEAEVMETSLTLLRPHVRLWRRLKQMVGAG